MKQSRVLGAVGVATLSLFLFYTTSACTKQKTSVLANSTKSTTVAPSEFDSVLSLLDQDLQKSGLTSTQSATIVSNARKQLTSTSLTFFLTGTDLVTGMDAVSSGAVSSLSNESLSLTDSLKSQTIQVIVSSLGKSLSSISESVTESDVVLAIKSVTQTAIESIPNSGLSESAYNEAIQAVVKASMEHATTVSKSANVSTVVEAITSGAVIGLKRTSSSTTLAVQLEAVTSTASATIVTLQSSSLSTEQAFLAAKSISVAATIGLKEHALSEETLATSTDSLIRGTFSGLSSASFLDDTSRVSLAGEITKNIISGLKEINANAETLSSFASTVASQSASSLKMLGVSETALASGAEKIALGATEGLRSAGVSEEQITQYSTTISSKVVSGLTSSGASTQTVTSAQYAIQNSLVVEKPIPTATVSSVTTISSTSTVASATPIATVNANSVTLVNPTATATALSTAAPTATAAATATVSTWTTNAPSISPSSAATGATLTCTVSFSCTNTSGQNVTGATFKFYRTRSGTSTLRGTTSVSSTAFTTSGSTCSTSTTYTLVNSSAASGNTASMDKYGDSMSCTVTLAASSTSITSDASSSSAVTGTAPVLAVSSGSATQSSLTAGSAIANVTLSATSADAETATITEVSDSCGILSIDSSNVVSGTMPSLPSPPTDVSCTASYKATASGLDSNTVSFNLVAPAPQSPSIAVSASSAPSVAYGSTGTVTITVTNSGSGSASSLSASSVSAPWSLTGGTCSSSLAANSSCTYVYTYTSPGVANSSTNVTVSYTGGSVQGTLAATGTALTGTVAAIYTNNPKWNDYVLRSDTSVDAYSQTDSVGSVCDGTQSSISSCIHSGEKRKIALTTESSCDGITATDALGAFNWVCKVTASQEVFIFMEGLKEHKGLRDLISTSGWRTNSVTVKKNNVTIYTTASATWWTNTVEEATANTDPTTAAVVTLGTASTIYYINSADDTTVATSGYHINADKVGIVTLGNTTLTFNGDGTNVSTTTGESASPSFRSIVAAGTQKFLWIETKSNCYNATASSNYAVMLFYVSFSRVNETSAAKCTSAGLIFSGSTSGGVNYSVVTGGSFADNGTAISLIRAVGNSFTNINIYNNTTALSGGSNTNVTGNTYTRIVAANNTNGFWGFQTRSTSHLITATSNSTGGWGTSTAGTASTYLTLSQALLSNNAYGVYLTATTTFRLAQIAGAGNGSLIHVTGGGSGLLSHYIVTDSDVCSMSNTTVPTNPGYDTGCGNATGDGSATSTSTLRSGVGAFDATFVGKITTETVENDGLKAFTSITDWLKTANYFRGWGVENSSNFPAITHRNKCTTGNDCRLWDWRLSSNDQRVLNKSNDGNSTTGATFTAGSACPAAVTGNYTMTDLMATPNTYLVNAWEAVGDAIGDEDGLCESSESCVYQPNFGAYMGNGDYRAARSCTFTNGTVTGVTMYGYPTNGG